MCRATFEQPRERAADAAAAAEQDAFLWFEAIDELEAAADFDDDACAADEHHEHQHAQPGSSGSTSTSEARSPADDNSNDGA